MWNKFSIQKFSHAFGFIQFGHSFVYSYAIYLQWRRTRTENTLDWWERKTLYAYMKRNWRRNHRKAIADTGWNQKEKKFFWIWQLVKYQTSLAWHFFSFSTISFFFSKRKCSKRYKNENLPGFPQLKCRKNPGRK